MRYIIETNTLCKTYGQKTVVNNVSLRVPEGCVYGFVGPNGAGKSTTMKMLLGLAKPTGGQIEIFGKIMNERNRLELLRQTGSLIESPSYYGHLTAQENLQIVADLKGAPKKEIEYVLEIVGLASDCKQYVKQFSLGMKQRLGIAQALLGNPKLLILDEPTNGLDPAGIQEIRSLIRSMPKQYGATVLISSHLLSELEQIVDQVGIINKGQLLFQGALEDLQQHSREEVSLHVLRPEKALPILSVNDVLTQDGSCFTFPAPSDEHLAQLTEKISANHAGIVELTRHTKSLEEIFLSLTREG